MHQSSLNFDTPRQLGTIGEQRAVAAASDSWRQAAMAALRKVCETNECFLVDLLWRELGELSDSPDKRAAAGILSEGIRRGWCQRTADLMRSEQKQTHGNLRSVYRSLIYQPHLTRT